MGDTAPAHQITHHHDHVAGAGQVRTELPQFTTSRVGEGGALPSVVRGLTQRPGGQARPGEDWKGSSWCPPGEDAPGLHTGPHAHPPGPRGGVASEVGPGGETDSWTGSLGSQGHTPTRSHAPARTHTLPGHMGTAGAPDSPTPEGPGQQRAAATAPNIHTHMHKPPMGWVPQWGRGTCPGSQHSGPPPV